MAHTSPHPVKIRYVSRDLDCTVQRTVGHAITCPRCHEKHKERTPLLARVWLYGHVCASEPER